ncbi:MAG: hypothetical protein N2712_05465 [Brevinematales bacterium]|nr:hypothetical protein [Brevinematales bacterium]
MHKSYRVVFKFFILLGFFVIPTEYKVFSQLVNTDVSNSLVQSSTNYLSIEDLVKLLEIKQFYTNFTVHSTNFLKPVNFEEQKSLRVSFEFDDRRDLKEKPFFMSYERRYEIILLVSIPTTYMVVKYLMEQVSFYNYKDMSRSLNTQQWAYVIASSIIVPLIIATEDYIKYKKFVEDKLKF